MSGPKEAVCLTGTRFQVGDMVTRGGDDDDFMIKVECIRASVGRLNEDGSRDEPVYKVGHTESNLTRRYSMTIDGTADVADENADGDAA